MPDSISYYRAAGLNPSTILPDCKLVQYKVVLLFDPLPDDTVQRVLADDPVRSNPETRKIARHLFGA